MLKICRVLFLIFCIFFVFGCSKNSNIGEDIVLKDDMKNKNFSSLSSEDFNSLYLDGYIAIDIRTKQEISMGKIYKNSLELDFYNDGFLNSLKKLDLNQKYIIYCRSGNRTKVAMDLMQKLGFKEVHDLDGGIVAWQKSGLNLNIK